jgi:hypothetical protein
MSKDPAKPSAVPVGNNAAEVRQFPLPSLRDFMLPDQLVLVQSFEAASLDKLDEKINDWIRKSSAIVAIPSSVNRVTLDGVTSYMISMTYLQAVVGNENV